MSSPGSDLLGGLTRLGQGHNKAFSEHGLVAYQIKENEASVSGITDQCMAP